MKTNEILRRCAASLRQAPGCFVAGVHQQEGWKEGSNYTMLGQAYWPVARLWRERRAKHKPKTNKAGRYTATVLCMCRLPANIGLPVAIGLPADIVKQTRGYMRVSCRRNMEDILGAMTGDGFFERRARSLVSWSLGMADKSDKELMETLERAVQDASGKAGVVVSLAQGFMPACSDDA